MTSGRYLGELGRLIILDYFTQHLHLHPYTLPPKLLARNGLRTTFLGYVRPGEVKALEDELPPPSLTTIDSTPGGEGERFIWDVEKAEIVYTIAKAIQTRGAAMVAAAILGLLACADELSLASSGTGKTTPTGVSNPDGEVKELLVGYTGGCIDHFQDYLEECQGYLDEVVVRGFEREGRLRVVLEPCHDGGIIGAGILAGTVEGMKRDG